MVATKNSNNKISSFPSSGRELLLELKRSSTTNNSTDEVLSSSSSSFGLAPYNVQLVRSCFQDLNRSIQALREEVIASQQENDDDDDDGEDKNNNNNSNKTSMNARPSILLHNAAIQRQKRCLLTYHKHRMDRIQLLTATTTTSSAADEISFQNAHEAEFATDYHELREAYSQVVGIELGRLPPTSHMVQVRVLSSHLGQVVLESGRTVSFVKGSTLYLPRSDVLEFLQAGSLELCDGEEIDF